MSNRSESSTAFAAGAAESSSPGLPRGNGSLPRWAGLVVLAALLVVAALSLLSLRPPAPVAATAPDSAFSAERAWRDLEAIAVAPHPAGSAAHAAVREYIVGRLEAIGLEPRIEEFSRAVRARDGVEHHFELSNLVAVLPGTDPTGALALVTHYDSHPRAPGAGDAGLAVAALLEAVRALRAGPPLRNDLVLLFTDGEELGLLGAREFVAADAAAADVRVVLNFEGRGSAGPALMFETGPGNAALVRTFHRAASRPMGSSLFPEAYRYLPNDTDFTIFLRAGMRGLNFAHIGRVETYHHPSDVPANASPATLQHHGEHALAMARAFGGIDLGTLPGPASGDAVFFNAPGVGLVRYPAGLALPHAVAVLALWMLVAVVGWRRSALRFAGVAAGFGLGTLVLLVGAMAAWGAGRIAGLQPDAGTLTDKLVVREWPYMLGIVAVSIAAVLAPLSRLARHLGPAGRGAAGLALGVVLVPALLGTAAAIVVPGASYLLLWPAAFAIAATHVVARPAAPTRRDALIVAVLLVPAVALWAPHVSLFLVGLTLRMAPALGLVAALAALSLAPLAALLRRAD